MKLKKILKIVCVLTFILCTVLGCRKREEIAQRQLKSSILQPNIQGVKEALRKKSKVNKRISLMDRRRPLELAVREIESPKIQLEICSLLIKNGAQINKKGLDHNTNLCAALNNGRFSLAEMMIEKGADVNQKGDENALPMDFATNDIRLKDFSENQKIINKLMESGAKVNSDFLCKFLKTEKWGMQYYFAPYIATIASKSGVNQKVSDAIKAAVFGNDAKLQRLIKAKQVKKNERGIVLALACAYCNVDTLKLLKHYGYDFSWKDGDKVGLLHIAAMCNTEEVIDYLLNIGIKGNQKIDYYKADEVSFAVLAGKLENARKLTTKGRVNYKENRVDGQNVTWEFISSFGNGKSCETLMRLGYFPKASEINSMFETCNEDQFNYLKTIDKDIYMKKYGGDILLSLSFDSEDNFYWEVCKDGAQPEEYQLEDLIWIGRSDVVRKVMEHMQLDRGIRTEVLLQSAIDIGDFPMVKYLVEHGADINKYVKDEDANFSWTSMQMAYSRQSTDIVKYLKQQGGNIKKKDTKGRNCKKIATDAEAIWNQ